MLYRLVVIGLLYMAYPDGCQHVIRFPAQRHMDTVRQPGDRCLFQAVYSQLTGDQPCICVLVPLISAVYASAKGIQLYAG